MALRRLLVLSMVAVFASSCFTAALWKATDPLEYVSVPRDEVSESELQERGVRYHKDDKDGVYYVEKTGLRRLGDYTIRALAAPATVVLDAATVIVVVGAAAGVAASRGEVERLKKQDRERRDDEHRVGHQW